MLKGIQSQRKLDMTERAFVFRKRLRELDFGFERGRRKCRLGTGEQSSSDAPTLLKLWISHRGSLAADARPESIQHYVPTVVVQSAVVRFLADIVVREGEALGSRLWRSAGVDG
jgi:hypothetical protein